MKRLPFPPFADAAKRNAPAVRDDACNQFLTFGELEDRALTWAGKLKGERGLVFLLIPNSVDGTACLLGAWMAGHAVALVDPAIQPLAFEALVAAYVPEFVVQADSDGQLAVRHEQGGGGPIHPDLFALLSTSGSTGSPKFVRLTQDNLLSNARAIAEVLDIREGETGCGHLPLHYSYGLSVLTSHLQAAAPVLLTQKGFTDRDFWPLVREAGVAHLPGVPFHFQMMQRLRYERLQLPSLRVLTQAGGSLNVEARAVAHAFMDARGGRFHVMYGQTEASPRMTTLSHDGFRNAPGSVGTALPGGRLAITDEAGVELPAGVEGHVRYTGPNVMMGYAEGRADLASGDTMNGWLETGDLGFLDEQGQLTLTGRAKRFGKVYGLRVNLDEIERLANSVCEAAIVQQGDHVHIYLRDADMEDEMLAAMVERYTLPRTAYKLHYVDAIPRTERGKTDYKALEAML